MRTLLAFFLLAMPALAQASPVQIMTFDGMPATTGATPWVEDGITATPGSGLFGAYSPPDTVHLDGSGPYASRVDFTTGSLFEPVSIDIRPSSSGYCAPGGCVDGFDPLDYISLVGFVDDVEVYSIAFYRPPSSEFETIPLDDFPAVDRLRVRVLTSDYYGLPGFCSTGVGCGHFDIDNLVIRAIPEPGTGMLLAAGLLCVALSRPRTRSS